MIVFIKCKYVNVKDITFFNMCERTTYPLFLIMSSSISLELVTKSFMSSIIFKKKWVCE